MTPRHNGCRQVEKRRGTGFTLIELLVALVIGLSLMVIALPVLGALSRDVRATIAYHRCLKVLQDGQKYLNSVKVADLSTSEPRVANAVFSGVAIVFFEDGQGQLQAVLTANQQGAIEPDPGNPGQSRYIQSTLNTARSPALPASSLSYFRHPYDILSMYEPLPMPSRVRVYGLVPDPNSPDPSNPMLMAVAPPFACCVNASGYGISPVPPAGMLEAKLNPNSGVRTDVRACISSLLVVHEERQQAILAAAGVAPSAALPDYGLERLTPAQLQASLFNAPNGASGVAGQRLVLMGTQSMSLLDY